MEGEGGGGGGSKCENWRLKNSHVYKRNRSFSGNFSTAFVYDYRFPFSFLICDLQQLNF